MPALPTSHDSIKPLGVLADLLQNQLGAIGVYFDLPQLGVISAKHAPPYQRYNWLQLLRGARFDLLEATRTMVSTIEVPGQANGYLIIQSPQSDHFTLASLTRLDAYAVVAATILTQAQQIQSQQHRIHELKTALHIAEAGLFKIRLSDASFLADETVWNLLGIAKSDSPVPIDHALANVKDQGKRVLLDKIRRVQTLGGRERTVFEMQDGHWCATMFMRDARAESGAEISGLLRAYTTNRRAELESEQHQSQLETLVRQLRASNRTDPLTGLANRIELNERLSVITRENRSAATWISMLVLDIDHFKSFNDSFGHAAGDIAIRQVANLIKHSIEPADLAARFGGEEFCVVTAAPLVESVALAEKIRSAVEFASWDMRSVTVSIGVCSMPAGEFESDALFKNADQALYQAKHGGRNCVRAYGAAIA